MKIKQAPWLLNGPPRSWIVPALLATFLVVSTGAARQAVHVERDPEADFAAFGSFALSVGTSWGSPICEKRVIASLSQRLEAAGWKAADKASADVFVVLHGSTKAKQSLHTFYDTWHGWGWRGWGRGSASTHVEEYTERTLVVDMFETGGQQLVWRGTAKGVAAPDPERNHARIERALDRMLVGFPSGERRRGRDERQRPDPK